MGNSWNLASVLLALVGLLGTCLFNMHHSGRFAQNSYSEFGATVLWPFFGMSLLNFPLLLPERCPLIPQTVSVKVSIQIVAPPSTLTSACPWVKSYKNTGATYCHFFLSSVDSPWVFVCLWLNTLVPFNRLSLCVCVCMVYNGYLWEGRSAKSSSAITRSRTFLIDSFVH